MKTLPEYFKPLLWSYKFANVDTVGYRDRIVVQAINYGSLKHWRWIAQFYGIKSVREVLQSVPVTEIREGVQPLARTLFGVTHFNYAPRGPAR